MLRDCRRLLVPLLALTAVARADEGGDALRALEHGIDLFKADHLLEARAAFEKARKLAPAKPNPYRWLGLADARLGDCAKAVPELNDFIARVPDGDPRTVEAVTIRERCLQELKPKVGTLVVHSDPEGAAVRLDDETAAPVGVTPWRASSLTVGAHGVFLSLRGYVKQFRSVVVSAGGTARIDVELAEQPVAAQEPPPPPPPRGRPVRAPIVSPLQLPERQPIKQAAIGLLVVALATGAAGLGVLISAELDYSQWSTKATGRPPFDDVALRGRIQAKQPIFDGLFAAAGGLALIDAILWGVAARPVPEQSVAIVPTLGGLAVSGRF